MWEEVVDPDGQRLQIVLADEHQREQKSFQAT